MDERHLCVGHVLNCRRAMKRVHCQPYSYNMIPLYMYRLLARTHKRKSGEAEWRIHLTERWTINTTMFINMLSVEREIT